MPSDHFLLLAAMPQEREPFLRAAQHSEQLHGNFGADRELHGVEIDGIPGEILLTGIGPVAAATALTAYFSTRRAPRLIVSVGSAGGLHPDLEVGTVVIGTEYRYADVDARAFGYEFGQVPGMPAAYSAGSWGGLPSKPYVREGTLVTSASFVSADLAEPIRAEFPQALAVDMESAALAQTCHIFGHRNFVSVRGISDLCSPVAGKEFHDGLGIAAARSHELTREILALA